MGPKNGSTIFLFLSDQQSEDQRYSIYGYIQEMHQILPWEKPQTGNVDSWAGSVGQSLTYSFHSFYFQVKVPVRPIITDELIKKNTIKTHEILISLSSTCDAKILHANMQK